LCIRDHGAVEDAFGTVVFVVAAVGAVVAVITLVGSGRSYRQIGRGGLAHERGDEDPGASAAGEREAEILQLLDARNARRTRRGEPALDVEAELAVLARPAVDASLRDELRELVVARNARRVRRGEAPLDVDAEVERRIRELN
jgi:hypothetical protein